MQFFFFGLFFGWLGFWLVGLVFRVGRLKGVLC